MSYVYAVAKGGQSPPACANGQTQPPHGTACGWCNHATDSSSQQQEGKQLTWYDMIQSLAFFCWSVGQSAIQACHAWGIVCAPSTPEATAANV